MFDRAAAEKLGYRFATDGGWLVVTKDGLDDPVGRVAGDLPLFSSLQWIASVEGIEFPTDNGTPATSEMVAGVSGEKYDAPPVPIPPEVPPTIEQKLDAALAGLDIEKASVADVIAAVRAALVP